MKRFLKNKVVGFLKSKGFEKINTGEDPKSALYDAMKSVFALKNDGIVSIIFSKDRAMQLDAFLQSYFEYVQNASTVKVLYHTSSIEHEKSYQDLVEIYKSQPVEFHKEGNFRELLLTIVENSTEDRLIFYVDDMLFSAKIDYNDLKAINPLEKIVCLSRGKDLVYSTVLAKPLQVPTIKPLQGNLFQFKWNEIPEFSDWTYPIGVSGYMFSRTEILAMMKATLFKAPNSLESNLQAFLPYFEKRDGVCYENVVTPCVHTNLTQTEGYNNVLGHYSLEELLKIWQEGKRIHYQEFLGLPVSEAETKKYSFIER